MIKSSLSSLPIYFVFGHYFEKDKLKSRVDPKIFFLG